MNPKRIQARSIEWDPFSKRIFIMARSHAADRDAEYMAAADQFKRSYTKNPCHAGAIHTWIHALEPTNLMNLSVTSTAKSKQVSGTHHEGGGVTPPTTVPNQVSIAPSTSGSNNLSIKGISSLLSSPELPSV